MLKDNYKLILKAVIPIIIAFISIFVVSGYVTSTQFNSKTIKSLDDKKATVMELTAASTAASAAITLIPGDIGTPIADKLADLSSYFIIVLCSIYLEKYLVSITGIAAFTILIPLACVLFSANTLLKNKACTYLAIKMILFGFAIVLVIPASVKVSNLIETTYESSIEETIESARQTTEEIGNNKEDDEEFISGIISKIEDGVSDATSKIESVLNNFIEALAVMIVTSCIIPILVLIFFAWLIKTVLGVNINVTKLVKKE